jgi:hypothetical protein
MTHLYRTQTTGNRRTFTVSTWIKFGNSYGSSGAIILNTDGDNANRNFMFQLNSDKLKLHLYSGDAFLTTRLIRDFSAWYHIVLGVDTTQATASNRMKLYVNGELQTISQESLYPSQNYDFGVGDNGRVMSIMGDHDNSNNYDNRSYISHYHFCDGYQYQASDFGETDSTTGEWKIKTNPSVNYGSTGFWLKFENSGNLTLDSGGNNISFSTSGTPIPTQDNPSNVFATLNPLHIQGTTSRSITYGNTRFYTTTTAWGSALSTLGFSSGKFYVEGKILTLNSSTGYGSIAIQDINAFGSSGNTDANLKGNNASAGLGLDYRSGQSNIQSGGSTVSSNVGDFSNNDIIGMAIDMDNKALYIHKNGTYYQIGGVTGVPTSGASKTGAITIPTSVETCAIGLGSYTSNADFCYNFGNGYFLSTAVSSAGTNASGNGIFEYDVPTGYTALSTKGLNL